MNLVLKFSLLFCLSFAQVISYSQGTWERINVPTHQYLKSLFFTDSLWGWVAGDSGTILHTIDGGNTWSFQDSHTQNTIEYLFFLNRNLGWASVFNYSTPPYGTVLLKTTDGGMNWTGENYPDTNIFITCILYRDSLNGWMGGRPHALVKTTNGGLDWTQADIDTNVLAFFPVLSIKFYNDKYGYASGGMFDIAGVIWRTSNGGDKWYPIDPSQAPADEVHELYIFDSIHVMGAGGDPDFGFGIGMIHTSDGGLNWIYKELGIQGTVYDLDFRNKKEAWAPTGPKQTLIYSLDSGSTWTEVPTPDSTSIGKMMFPDSLHGFAVGREGAMLRYKPPVTGAVDPHASAEMNGFILYQNVPNPFFMETTIRFTVPASQGNGCSVQVKVFDILGKEVATPFNEKCIPGNYEISWDPTGLPCGIFYYRLLAFTRDGKHLSSLPRKMIRIE